MVRAKKRYGQHFLVDKNIICKILDLAEVDKGESVLEIGPGTGTLTEALLDRGANVTSIEVDRELAALLSKNFEGERRLTVINADALKTDLTAIAGERGGRLKLVSNLPYNISGPMLARLIEQREAFSLMVLMLQKEVAQRVVARPSTKDYGALSVICQAFTDASYGFEVSPRCFSPRPKVVSAVIALSVRETPSIDVLNEEDFKRVVKAAFAQRRKTISNSLKTLGLGAKTIAEALEGLGMDTSRRAETLSVEEFGALASRLYGEQADKESGL